MKECPICHTCFSDNNEVCNNDKSPLLDLIAGSHIIADKYRLDRKIGVGRIGIVFQATILKTGQRVAIKIVSPLLVEADPSLVEKFFILIEAFAALEHVNIVKIFDFGLVEPNILYFVMEFLALPTLADLLQEQKRLSLELALNITSKVCEAIANANRSAVFHLDLKPSNIFVERVESKQQMVKVVDFGLVRLKAPSLISALSPMQRDYLLGKPYYSAPEQFTSEQIDPRSEVYAIGAILYHLLVGNPPFTGGSYPMLKMQHIGVTPPSLREIRPEIPLTLESIIIKALDKRSAQRHSSVIALAVQLSAQLAKYKEFLLSQSSNNTIPSLPSPPEPFYSSDPTPPPISKYPSKEVFLSQSNNTIPSLPSPPEPFYSSDPT
ncbi:MAG: protein kinase, partial [Acidobacteria bacterium]|nr:protein kinase [Acidobacteriota bacterium]